MSSWRWTRRWWAVPHEIDSCERLHVDLDGVSCTKGHQLSQWCKDGPRLDCNDYRRAMVLTLDEVKAKYADPAL